MSVPNLLSTVELPGGDFVADEEPTVHNALPGLKSAFKPRPYQLEMLEESMRRNIIVAMDTGSGKTAILRIQAELERCPAGKFVWLCVPTVALAIQQHKALSTQLPAFQSRVLSGADNVEFWTEQWIWDDVLKGIDIVISTHQVLLDALVHGFVQMNQLALLVFDEAHSCIGNHPSSRILRDFYHVSTAEARPSILGLSASPVVNSKVGNLGLLESNLNAISRTPKIHRDEMLQFIHQPELIKLVYLPNGSELVAPQALKSLRKVYLSLDVEQDPWVIKMKSDPSTCKAKALEKALISNRTYCHDQIKSLYDRALAVHHELGSFAAEYYIRQCVAKLRRGVAEGSFVIEGLKDAEKLYLSRKFAEVVVPEPRDYPLENHHTTPKVQALVQFLREIDSTTFSGLIFVRTRAEVAVLSQILSIQAPWFKVATFVGESGFSGRRNPVGDLLVDLKNQKETLDDLRLGKKNLIVTTNALEEGIDVSACNVVICFEKPPNLKSFIQRRGRARRSESKYVIMFEADGLDHSAISSTWVELEEEMRRTYADEQRLLQEVQELESLNERGEREFLVEATGARLTPNDAVQHLYHFCAALPAAPYVDLNPIFTFEEHSSGRDGKSISAKVLLPNSVDVSVRSACSKSRWITEKMARKDAAFEAYKALYHAGLVNDNLLPLGHVDEAVDQAYGAVEKRPSIVKVSDQIDVWPSIAQCWQSSGHIYGTLVQITGQDQVRTDMMMLLPIRIPAIPDIDLYWDKNTTFQLVIEPETSILSPAVTASAAQITSLLLESVFRGRVDYGRLDFTALFMPSNGMDHPTWLSSYSGALKAEDLCDQDVGRDVGLVRDLSHNGTLHIFHQIIYAYLEDIPPEGTTKPLQHQNTDPYPLEKREYQPSEGVPDCSIQLDRADRDQCVLMEMKRLPKRADFLHPVPSGNASSAKQSGIQRLLAKKCEVGRLPFSYSRFALFIPSLLHKVQLAMTVERLCDTVLSPLHFHHRGIVASAIIASSAHEATDYQRLETLGDSILKFMTSLTLMAEHLNYHEGILSHQKDHIVSNSSLATAAMRTGLDRYIITKPFTGQKWRPLYNGKLAANQPERTREMSTKTLADVVEALIGAAYLEGPEKAAACLEIFLPEVPWSTALQASQILYRVYGLQIPVSTHVKEAQKVISYDFNLKALLNEALTHPSHYGPNTSSSYQRLEFCGDAILDKIVTTTAFAHNPPLPTHQLHLIRAALVNANFLGFLCLTLSISIPRFEALGNDAQNITTTEVPHTFCLWQSMRHASPSVHFAQQACLARHQMVHTEISNSLANGTHYPWTALARLEPPKFFSDIIESILGAVYIDTQGSMSASERFLNHLGLMPYLRRVLENEIAVLHPKEELGQLADQDKVRYILGKEGEEGEERLSCTVIVGERSIVKVGDGLSTMEVQTRAADEACKILRREKSTYGNGDSREVVKAVRADGQGEDDETLSEDEDEDEEGQATVGAEDDSDEYMTADE